MCCVLRVRLVLTGVNERVRGTYATAAHRGVKYNINNSQRNHIIKQYLIRHYCCTYICSTSVWMMLRRL